MKHISLLFIIYFLFFNFLGCALIKESGRGLAGISTKVLEERRKDAIVKKFDFDYNTCYAKIKKYIQDKGSSIYTEDPKKHLIAIYVSAEDTTPVGIFFTQLSPTSTQVEVSSASTYAKEFIAGRVSRAFVLGKHLEEEKGQADAKGKIGN